jgi:hypothetical protein
MAAAGGVRGVSFSFSGERPRLPDITPRLVFLAQYCGETICYPLEHNIGPYASIKMGKNTHYLVVVIITDTSQNRILGP